MITIRKLQKQIELFHKFAHIPVYDMDEGVASLDEAKKYPLERVLSELDKLEQLDLLEKEVDKKREEVQAKRRAVLTGFK